MWSIVWKIANTEREDSLSFESEEQANRYARYYKHVLKLHNRSPHIRRRFSFSNKEFPKRLIVRYQVIKKSNFTPYQKGIP